MLGRFGFMRLVAIALLFTAVSAGAADNRSIQGAMIDEDGKLIRGAVIRVKRLDAKAKILSVKTNNRGMYVFESLPAGLYEVTAYLDGYPQSRARVRTRNKGWAKVDFDLRRNDAESSDVDRMQRDIHSSTGTPIGR